MPTNKIDIAEWITLLLGAAISWLIYRNWLERVRLKQGQLVKKHLWRSESLSIDDICAIKYHYHAVVGFIAVWEFIDQHDNTLTVEASTRGLDEVFQELEKRLPGFSLDNFEQQFRDGDVEDTLDIWSRADLPSNDKSM